MHDSEFSNKILHAEMSVKKMFHVPYELKSSQIVLSQVVATLRSMLKIIRSATCLHSSKIAVENYSLN